MINYLTVDPFDEARLVGQSEISLIG